MPRERERKYRVPAARVAALRLELERRALARVEEQDNTLYDFVDGRLEAADSAVRVRRTADRVELAFKGPRTYSGRGEGTCHSWRRRPAPSTRAAS